MKCSENHQNAMRFEAPPEAPRIQSNDEDAKLRIKKDTKMEPNRDQDIEECPAKC